MRWNRPALTLLFASACGGSPAPVADVTAGDEPAPILAVDETIEAPPAEPELPPAQPAPQVELRDEALPTAGRCGGLERARLATRPTPLLGGRFGITLPGNLQAEGDDAGGTSGVVTATSLASRGRSPRAWVEAVELGRRSPEDFGAAARAEAVTRFPQLGNVWLVAPIGGEPSTTLTFRPATAPEGASEPLPVLAALTRHPDGFVTAIVISVERARAADLTGCSAVAARWLASLTANDAPPLAVSTGPTVVATLSDELVAQLDATGWLTSRYEGEDFTVTTLTEVVELGQPGASVAFTVSSQAEIEAATREGTVQVGRRAFDRPMGFFAFRDERPGSIGEEAMYDFAGEAGQVLHIRVRADDEAARRRALARIGAGHVASPPAAATEPAVAPAEAPAAEAAPAP